MAGAGEFVRASDAGGLVGYAESSSSVVLSTTAGTFSDLVSDTTVTVVSGKRYKVTFQGWDVLVGGGSFAITDQWLVEVQHNDSGSFVTCGGVKWNAGVANGNRYPVWTITGFFVAASSHTITVKARACKNVGNAAVTSTVEADATHQLTVAVEELVE